MTIIEGIGDEVIQFFGVVFVLMLGLAAWWSTGIRDLPQIRTVLILERRSQNVSTQQPNLGSQRVTGIDTGQGDQGICRQRRLAASRNADNKRDLSAAANDIRLNRAAEEPSDSEPVSRNEENISTSQNEPLQNDDSGTGTEQNINEDSSTGGASDNIRIRLKYLNDDQKLVDGRLQELLGDFKRRHFSVELAAQKLVRLIFNGQVLQRDDQTLQGCGLFDNCVVHCLVQAQQNAQRSNTQQNMNSPPPDWNLGGLLYTCLSILLGLAWFCRYNYSHLFTLTTTAALVGLTGMFVVSVYSSYLPEPISNN